MVCDPFAGHTPFFVVCLGVLSSKASILLSKRANCFTLYLCAVAVCVLCSMSLPLGAGDCFVVCDCGIPWPY